MKDFDVKKKKKCVIKLLVYFFGLRIRAQNYVS